MWVQTQRRVYRGLVPGIMNEERINKLNAIGMEWQTKNETMLEKYMSAARAYSAEHGDLDMPALYVTPDGTPLGRWISNLRIRKKANADMPILEQVKEELNQLGMIWDKLEQVWNEYYMAAKDYYDKHGNIDCPIDYRTEDGKKLGQWIAGQRQIRLGNAKRSKGLSKDRIEKLDAIGMNWVGVMNAKWDMHYAEAKMYYEDHGNLDPQTKFVTDTGFALGRWLKVQIQNYHNGTLSPDRVDKLNEIGMTWDRDMWMPYYELCKEYYEVDGSSSISTNIAVNGMWIGKWLCKQQGDYEKGKLSTEQQKLLKEIKAIR